MFTVEYKREKRGSVSRVGGMREGGEEGDASRVGRMREGGEERGCQYGGREEKRGGARCGLEPPGWH